MVRLFCLYVREGRTKRMHKTQTKTQCKQKGLRENQYAWFARLSVTGSTSRTGLQQSGSCIVHYPSLLLMLFQSRNHDCRIVLDGVPVLLMHLKVRLVPLTPQFSDFLVLSASRKLLLSVLVIQNLTTQHIQNRPADI